MNGKTKNSQNTVTFNSDVELNCYSDVELESDEDEISSREFIESSNDDKGNEVEDTLRGINTKKRYEKLSYLNKTPIVNSNYNPRFPRKISDEEIQIRDIGTKSRNKSKAYLETGSTFFHEDRIPQRWYNKLTDFNPNEDVYPNSEVVYKSPKGRLSSRFITELGKNTQ